MNKRSFAFFKYSFKSNGCNLANSDACRNRHQRCSSQITVEINFICLRWALDKGALTDKQIECKQEIIKFNLFYQKELRSQRPHPCRCSNVGAVFWRLMFGLRAIKSKRCIIFIRVLERLTLTSSSGTSLHQRPTLSAARVLSVWSGQLIGPTCVHCGYDRTCWSRWRRCQRWQKRWVRRWLLRFSFFNL